MPNHQKTDGVLEAWSSLREKIGNLKLSPDDKNIVFFFNMMPSYIGVEPYLDEKRLARSILRTSPTNELVIKYKEVVLYLVKTILILKHGDDFIPPKPSFGPLPEGFEELD